MEKYTNCGLLKQYLKTVSVELGKQLILLTNMGNQAFIFMVAFFNERSMLTLYFSDLYA